MRRWALWLLPILGVVTWIAGMAIDDEDWFSARTGFLALHIYLAGFLVAFALDPEA